MSTEDFNEDKSIEEKKPNNDKKEKFTFSGLFTNLKKSFKDHKSEFDKITWPNRKDLSSKTVTVIVTSLFFGVIIFGLDSVYQVIFKFILNLVS